MKYLFHIIIIVAIGFISCNQSIEQVVEELPVIDSVFEQNLKFIEENYSKQEYYIPMRDGAKLHTVVYAPKDISEDYPIMLLRTPYSVELSKGSKYGYWLFKFGLSHKFFEEKFIFVNQDVRGRFMSEGEFENMRPQLSEYKDSTDIDESTDTFDTIEWLIQNLENNNGNVGMYGISYPGFYAAAGAINAHPALKAVSPQAPISDWFWDDFHHNGAFMLNASYGFFGVFGIPRPELTKYWPQSYAVDTFKDGYQFYLNELTPVSNINSKYYKDRILFWNQFIEHPNYDEFWQKRSIIPHLKDIKPAILTVGGWFDAEDLYGPLKIYEAIEKNSPGENENYLVMGPWFHGGWSRSWGTELGEVYFGENPAPSRFYQDHIEFPFFMHHLKGAEYHNLAEASVFETGNNIWRTFDSWPPKNMIKKELYLHKDQILSFEKPIEKDAFSEYVSDPENPVPFTSYVTNNVPKKYMVDNQEYASRREDVLVFQTEPLKEDITIAGNIMANLMVEMTGTDADFIVKLIDVYPENIGEQEPFYEGKEMGGYQQLLRGEVMRGRFRESFEHPKPFEPNKITEVDLELLDVLHTFKKGHRIMVQIQSTWFPLVDINPQNYVENIYKAKIEDFTNSNIKIHHSEDFASYIEFGVLN